jgi:hypothetical protein
MRTFSLAVVLLVAFAASAQQPTIVGERNVQEYGFAELSVNTPAAVIWQVYPKPVMKVVRSNVLYFSGPPGVEYLVTAVVFDFDKRTADQVEVTVSFAGKQPLPPPPPIPPPDVDPLVNGIQTAANDETTEERKLLPKLAELYRDAQAKVDGAATWGALFQEMSKIAESKGVSGKLQKVQRILQTELKNRLPSKGAGNLPIDVAGKQTAKTVFSQINQALLKVK